MQIFKTWKIVIMGCIVRVNRAQNKHKGNTLKAVMGHEDYIGGNLEAI